MMKGLRSQIPNLWENKVEYFIPIKIESFLFENVHGLKGHKQVGNAVPPPLARALGNELKKCLIKKATE
jgi:site-specific DNA-cytosine methylase